LASAICWIIALLLKKKTKRCSSPLLKADAAGWIVNAAISSAAFAAFAGMWVLGFTPYKAFAPYVDPLLVILVGGITLSITVRMAWTALMELVNRAPSAEIRTAVRETVEREMADVPAEQITVRVLQPGRVRLVYVHVVLQPSVLFSVEQMDGVREKVWVALTELHENTQSDILFTKDRRWGALLPILS
jgi:predicted Co/Zn/Cd cation transporter (cation efflux family)